MKNMIHIRNSVIIVLCITIIFMGIGFIVLSVDLKNKKDEVHSFDVIFTSVNRASSVKGSNIEPTGKANIIENGKEIDMAFTMNAFHDELVYIAKIKNKGTLPAEIVDIIESPDYKEDSFNKLIFPVSITLSNIKGKIIAAGEEMDLKIVVYYNPSSNPSGMRTFQYKIGLITKSR